MWAGVKATYGIRSPCNIAYQIRVCIIQCQHAVTKKFCVIQDSSFNIKFKLIVLGN